VLSQAEIDSFTADGYVAVRSAVPADVLRRCQEEIWSALGEHGVRRDDPSTWREPVVRISCPRIMAQPGVALHDAFPLVPPLSPVELAMSPERAA
jgi:hypothetical protein